MNELKSALHHNLDFSRDVNKMIRALDVKKKKKHDTNVMHDLNEKYFNVISLEFLLFE